MQVSISSCLRQFAGILRLGSEHYLIYSPWLTSDLLQHPANKRIRGGACFWGDGGRPWSTYDR